MTNIVEGVQEVMLWNIFMCGAHLLLRYIHVFVGMFRVDRYVLCSWVWFVFVFVGVVLVLHYFSRLSIYCIFEEIRQRNHLFIYYSL